MGVFDVAGCMWLIKNIDSIAELEMYLKATREKGVTLWHQLKQTGNPFGDTLAEDEEVAAMGLPADAIEAAVIDARYEGYLKRQAKQIESFRNLEKIKLPEEIDYKSINHLSNEAKSKLSKYRPATLGRANRIGGVSPADISVLQVELARRG
jgi:tRNA uridine 5-carboxymethylaminomethyl modification enzyme